MYIANVRPGWFYSIGAVRNPLLINCQIQELVMTNVVVMPRWDGGRRGERRLEKTEAERKKKSVWLASKRYTEYARIKYLPEISCHRLSVTARDFYITLPTA